MDPIISFKGFSFQYTAQKNPTLKNINLDIFRGEKVIICGASGSGKSTLGNCINGLIPFSYNGKITGSLTVCGIETQKASIFELSNHVGTVLQDSDGQFIGLTVAEDIAFSLENNRVPQQEMFTITSDAAASVGVSSHLDHSPQELSGGQKQRVSLAGVLVGDAEILLFDEPLANLDPRTGKGAIELIDNIYKQQNKTCIIIEHRLEDALWRKADRIILMDDGKIVADMSPDELLSTSLLIDYGIREPLYITCCKYAGVNITADKQPAHIHTLKLEKKDISKIRHWYEDTDLPRSEISDESILRVEDVSFSYSESKKPVLQHVSFDIKKGEMVSIVGQNGAGKSTLAKVICGFETNMEGKIFYHGEDITSDTIRSRARHIGYVMQNPNAMISQSMIYDEVALGLKYQNLPEDEIRQKVKDILKVCGLYEFRNWPISALSYGQKKRVTIASILIMGPEIIILDEPTAGQDFRHYTEIMRFLAELNRQGITIILITHDMHLMLEYTPRSLVMTGGRLLADESSSAVLCDRELIEKASLKETSLFVLAEKCGIDDPVGFTDRFIYWDRKEQHHGS